jgi:hypothetical protein
MGLKEQWAKWTGPETPEPKRENCTDDEAMKILSEELAVHVDEKHGPEPMGMIHGVDKEAIILANTCLTVTAIVILIGWMV